MLTQLRTDLYARVGDAKLVDEFLKSYEVVTTSYLANDPVGLLQHTGLYVEAGVRILEHMVLGAHTPLSKNLNIDDTLEKLQKASGPAGLRIHSARLFRAAYDFRSRMKAVHLKDIDPRRIDGELIYHIATWGVIEIVKELGSKHPEQTVRVLFTRKIPLVAEVGGVLRTTNPTLKGTHRILLLLYTARDGLTFDELFTATRLKIKTKNHLRTNLKNLAEKDCVHQRDDGRWVVFGPGITEAEKLILQFAHVPV